MEKLKITGDWGKMKEKLQSEYPELTDEDLKFRKGEEDMLVGRIERRLGRERKEKVIDRIKDFHNYY